jgi:hypothetical protein
MEDFILTDKQKALVRAWITANTDFETLVAFCVMPDSERRLRVEELTVLAKEAVAAQVADLDAKRAAMLDTVS